MLSPLISAVLKIDTHDDNNSVSRDNKNSLKILTSLLLILIIDSQSGRPYTLLQALARG